MSNDSFFSIEDLPHDELRPGTDRHALRFGAVELMWISYDGSTDSPPHDHGHPSVIVVDRGECTITVDGETRVVRPGEGAVIPAHVQHSLSAQAGTRIVELWYPDPDHRSSNA